MTRRLMHNSASEQRGDRAPSKEPFVKSRDPLVVLLATLTGVTDAIGFVLLGHIFTSVMTGNLVLLGIYGSRADGGTIARIGAAMVAYVIGTYVGARIAGPARSEGSTWPTGALWALVFEWFVMAAFGISWLILGGHADGLLQGTFLAMNSLALGAQGAAVLRLGVPGLSTTYMTGTMTGVIAGLATGHHIRHFKRSVVVLLALTAGAGIGGVLAQYTSLVAPIAQLRNFGICGGTGLAKQSNLDCQARCRIRSG